MKPHSTGTIFAAVLIRFASVCLFLYAVLSTAAGYLSMMAYKIIMEPKFPYQGTWQLQWIFALGLGIFAILLIIFSLPLGRLLAKGLNQH